MTIHITDQAIRIDGLQVAIPEVHRWFADQLKGGCSPDNMDNLARRCLHLGVLSMERAQGASSVDFVRAEVETMLTRLSKELAKQIGTDDGQVLAPVQRKVDEVQALLREDLNPHKDGSVLFNLRAMLDPNRTDSIQGMLTSVLRDLGDREKPLAKSLQLMMEDTLKPVLERLKSLEGDKTLKEGSTLKGYAFEDEIEEALGQWQKQADASIERVGGDNDTGDFLVTMRDPLDPQLSLLIVVEVKDRQNPIGRKQIGDKMRVAIEARSAGAGVWVCRSAEGFAKEIHDWSEGTLEDGSPWTACTVQHMISALRWTYIQWRWNRVRSERVELDAAVIAKSVRSMRDRMKELRTINTQAGQIHSAADLISVASGTLKKSIEEELSRMEEELRKDRTAAAIETSEAVAP